MRQLRLLLLVLVDRIKYAKNDIPFLFFGTTVLRIFENRCNLLWKRPSFLLGFGLFMDHFLVQYFLIREIDS